MQNLTLLVGRLLLSALFIVAGAGKLATYAATTQLLAAQGVAPGLLPLVICVELGGGLLVLAGLFTRWAAVALFVYALLTTIVFHDHLADHTQWAGFLEGIAVAGGYLLLAMQGAGSLSLDAWRRRRKQRQKLFF